MTTARTASPARTQAPDRRRARLAVAHGQQHEADDAAAKANRQTRGAQQRQRVHHERRGRDNLPRPPTPSTGT